MWIGYYEATFVLFSILLSVGWFLNTLSAPAYFANLGIGELRWNTVAHIVIAALNLGLGLLLGSIYGGKAVVAAWVFSLIIGSSIIPISYHHRHNISRAELLPKESAFVAFASIIGISTSLLLYYQLFDKLTPLIGAITLFIIFLLILVIPIWLHPMRKRLIGWVTFELFKKQQEGL
ncbi:hypothetical protein [Candidatus Methanoperedens nitratireducens]|uniref:Uncharacterized protein n=1 Tax=Candidatus Methanoperedens nitratireducens TaxID=1392998 RepID=A0A284VNT8_9EURY|nr:hypothetical protein [Candidatus Methanoperedens nitroreducens]SNQ60934.1 membrane hypothetical protein [Candidatus Methanoperedens nitroreducens]